MKKLLLLTLCATSTLLIAETVDEKRFRTSPLLTQSQITSATNAKILASHYKNSLSAEEQMAFVENALANDIDVNNLPATAAGNNLSPEAIGDLRHSTSPFSKRTNSAMKAKSLSDDFNNLLDNKGRAQFVDAVLAK
jgi:hypothetical protein